MGGGGELARPCAGAAAGMRRPIGRARAAPLLPGAQQGRPIGRNDRRIAPPCSAPPMHGHACSAARRHPHDASAPGTQVHAAQFIANPTAHARGRGLPRSSKRTHRAHFGQLGGPGGGVVGEAQHLHLLHAQPVVLLPRQHQAAVRDLQALLGAAGGVEAQAHGALSTALPPLFALLPLRGQVELRRGPAGAQRLGGAQPPAGARGRLCTRHGALCSRNGPGGRLDWPFWPTRPTPCCPCGAPRPCHSTLRAPQPPIIHFAACWSLHLPSFTLHGRAGSCQAGS